MNIRKNNIYIGSNSRKSLYDVFYVETNQPKEVIIFSHGFKGFKDYGCFNEMAIWFAQQGYVFIKYNFSHNGGTITNSIDFDDLETFSQNNYSKEIYDLGIIIDELCKGTILSLMEINSQKISLLGHSRGGGISIIKAFTDKRISAIVTIGSISSFNRFPKGEPLSKWEKEKVIYIENTRTHQQMPLGYQLYEDYITHKELLNIQNTCKNLQKPYLIIHGDKDETVSMEEAKLLHNWCKSSTLKIIENANHTLGSSHPWGKQNLPKAFLLAVEKINNFLKHNS